MLIPQAANSKANGTRSVFVSRLILLFEYALSTTFIAFGLLKLFSGPATTKIALLTLGVSEPTVVWAVARTLPIFEITLGVWLAVGFRRRAAAGTALTILTLFSCSLFALGQVAGWGSPCNCTGTPAGAPIYIALIRNVILWASALALTILHHPGGPPRNASLYSRAL